MCVSEYWSVLKGWSKKRGMGDVSVSLSEKSENESVMIYFASH